MIKAIKGKDNPADLGTKSRSRDKIRKYMVTIGYIGDYLDQEAQEENIDERRASERRRRLDEVKISRTVQAVTTAVMISLGEAKKQEEESQGPMHSVSIALLCMLSMLCIMCVTAAVFSDQASEGKLQEEEEKTREEKEEGQSMASDDAIKKLIEKSKASKQLRFWKRVEERVHRRERS